MTTRVKKTASLLSMLFILLAVQGLGLAEAATETIRINGSGAALDILVPLVKAYGKRNPGVKFKVEKPLGSTGAIKALLSGVLDIAVSSKILTSEEAAFGALAAEYGKIPLSIVSAAGVGKKDITTRELEDIYSGKVKKWPNGETIRIVLRPKEDIDTKILASLSRGMGTALREAYQRQGMLFAVTDPEAVESIVRTPGAIGIAAICCAHARKGKMQALRLNGRKATAKGVAEDTYPLAKDIRFITTRKTTAAALDFLRFVYSAKGRAIAEKEGILVTARSAGGL